MIEMQEKWLIGRKNGKSDGGWHVHCGEFFEFSFFFTRVLEL